MNLVCDVDGILTTGEHFYSSDGKFLKSFGSNEKDALNVLLKKYIDKVIFSSADGGDINISRLSEFKQAEYRYCSVESRQNLINEMMPCIYIGDGIFEPTASLTFCLNDSTPQAKNHSDIILNTTSGKNIFPHLLDWFENKNLYDFALKISNSLKNKIIITGVGKNFSLSQLVCEFFLPYNIIAVPLDANHSMHGSLGLIKESDILIASSKSGNTKELVEMIESLKKKLPGFKNSFLITSTENSKCSNYFQNTYVAEKIEENSLHCLSPQSTIEQYLKIYFKILNIINQNINFSKNDYLLNHQGGTIGKK